MVDQNYSKEYFDRLLQIWDQERMPEEWEIGIICPIFKKGDHRECSSYRGITLLNIIYKIFTCLIYNRLTKYSETALGEYQAGFRAGRSTIDQIHVVRQILEKCYEFGIELHSKEYLTSCCKYGIKKECRRNGK